MELELGSVVAPALLSEKPADTVVLMLPSIEMLAEEVRFPSSSLSCLVAIIMDRELLCCASNHETVTRVRRVSAIFCGSRRQPSAAPFRHRGTR